MVLPFNPKKMQARAAAQKLQVLENMVRNRLEHGPPLSAQEIIDGVKLTHDDFLYLVRMAMPSLNRDLTE